MAYNREGDTIYQEYRLEPGGLRMTAQDVRRERTGVHATLCLLLNNLTVAWSRINIEDARDRQWLANKAFMAYGKDRGKLSKDDHSLLLDRFCRGLWAEHVGSIDVELMVGNPDLPPPRMLLGNYIMEGGGTILYAPPGQGKSYTALAWAICALHGHNSLWSIKECRPLYINLERSHDSVKWRVGRICRALGITDPEPLPFIQVRGKPLIDVYDSCRRAVDKEKCDLVFLDSISRAGFGKLSEDTPANKIVDSMNDLARSWVALGHTPRQDPTHVFGSMHFEAGQDIGVMLRAQYKESENITGVGLTVTQANDTRTGGLDIHALEFGEGGLQNIRRAKADEFPDIASGRRMSTADKLEEYLREVGITTATEAAQELQINRSNVAATFRSDKRFVAVRKEGNRVLYGLSANR